MARRSRGNQRAHSPFRAVTSSNASLQFSLPHHQTHPKASFFTKHAHEQIPVSSCITQDPENVSLPLKERDDNDVENFIKIIRKAQLRCNWQNLLLDFIIAKKIIENAKRAIRFTLINTFKDIYEALRHNLGTNSAQD